jgi:hypothetical protein
MTLPIRRARAASDLVVLLRFAAVVACGLVLLHLPASAAILIHEYALRGSLDDNVGENSLSSVGGQITALGYVFAANQGLTFSSRAFTPTDYSVELSFKLDSAAGTTKLADFHNLTADPGLYQQNGTLSFSPFASSGVSDFAPGADMHVVLTRDGSTNVVTAFVNGQQRFSFLDDETLAAVPGFSNKLSFFLNDGSDPNASGGTLNYLRVFNGALSSSDVSALLAAGPPIAVPEPSTLILLMLGGVAVGTFNRARSRRSE